MDVERVVVSDGAGAREERIVAVPDLGFFVDEVGFGVGMAGVVFVECFDEDRPVFVGVGGVAGVHDEVDAADNPPEGVVEEGEGIVVSA